MNNYRDVPANSMTKGAKIYGGYLSSRAIRFLDSQQATKVSGRGRSRFRGLPLRIDYDK